MTNPLGQTTDYTYDKLGRNRTVTEHVTDGTTVENLTTTSDYDAAGNRISVTDPTGAVTTSVYSRTGQLLKTTDPLGYITTVDYDVANRAVKTIAPSGVYTTTTYDPAGRAIETATYTPAGVKTLFTTGTYDNVGNTISTTTAGVTSSYTYDATNALTSVTSSYTYDATNALTSVTQPITAGVNQVTSYGYDPAGHVTRITDGNNNTWWATYNTWGLIESRIEPSTPGQTNLADRTFTTRYDEGGLPVRDTEPGVTINRTFDALGRTKTETASGVSRSFTYDILNRPKTITFGSATINLDYNERSQIIKATGAAGTSEMRYDDAGRPVERKDGTLATTYSWYSNGQLNQVGDPITGTTHTYTWNAPNTAHAGQLDHVTSGSTTRTYGYDNIDRLTSDTVTTGASTVWSATYGYQPSTGRLASKTIAPAGVAGAGTNTYTYDLAGRLDSWTNPANVTTTYTYDLAGNRTHNGATAITFDARNRITSEGTKTYDWSARGTLNSITDGAGTTNYTFDDFGHMTTAGGVNYTYDGLDRITTRGTTPFTYSLLNNQPTSDGTTTIARTPDGSPLSVNQGATALNLIADRHGDIVATVTAAGALTDSIAYTPWGEQAARTGTTALTVGYQSSYTDPTTGLIDMGARWYQASTGTFTSRDTYNGELSNPISLNRYTYAQGDPMAYFDPDGHISADVAARQAAVKKRYRDPRSADRADREGRIAQARLDRSRLTADHADRIITEYRRKATNYALQNAYQQRLAELRKGKSDINPQDDPILREIAHMVVQNNFSVFDTAKHGGDGDGSIGKVDFEAVKKNKNGQYDPLLAWAAGQLLANGKGAGDPHSSDYKLGDEGWKVYDIIKPEPFWKTALAVALPIIAVAALLIPGGFAIGAALWSAGGSLTLAAGAVLAAGEMTAVLAATTITAVGVGTYAYATGHDPVAAMNDVSQAVFAGYGPGNTPSAYGMVPKPATNTGPVTNTVSAPIESGNYVVSTSAGEYVGQSGNISTRLDQHVASGKFTQAEVDAAQRFSVPGTKLDREIAEQLLIDSKGGIDNLLNKVNPIGPKRFGVMPNQPYAR